jgi:hypothetical protein
MANDRCDSQKVPYLAFLCVLVFLLCAGTAQGQRGAIVLHQNLAELSDEAATIVRGRVASVEAERHPQYYNLHTVVVSLQVEEVLKGSAEPVFTFRQYVHDIRDRETHLGYKPGQEVLLFMIQPSDYGLSSPAGLEQGRFRILADAQGNRSAVNGLNNYGLLKNMESTVSKLGPEGRSSLEQLMMHHRGGPIQYEELARVIRGVVAARSQ